MTPGTTAPTVDEFGDPRAPGAPRRASAYRGLVDTADLLALRSDDRAALLLIGLRGDW
ncbi:hypothetical protein [Blastococcus sp. SYSU DS0533]